MGAWGVKPFENDDAADFVYQVESDGLDAILSGLDAAATADYCEADQGAQAVAAAALAAAARDGQEDLLSREAAEALATIREAVLAKAGLWNAVIDDLMERLSE